MAGRERVRTRRARGYWQPRWPRMPPQRGGADEASEAKGTGRGVGGDGVEPESEPLGAVHARRADGWRQSRVRDGVRRQWGGGARRLARAAGDAQGRAYSGGAMSHITDVQTQYKDLDALKEAAEACGFTFMDGQKTHA